MVEALLARGEKDIVIFDIADSPLFQQGNTHLLYHSNIKRDKIGDSTVTLMSMECVDWNIV